MCTSSQTNNVVLSVAGPIVTDNGNFIIDAPFDREMMKEPFEVGVVVQSMLHLHLFDIPFYSS